MKKLAIAALALLLASCSDVQISKGQLIGGTIGAIAGGAIGYQFGGGMGQWLFTAAATMVGGEVGIGLGEKLLPSDQTAHEQNAQKSLAQAPDGQIYNWRNNKTGNSGNFRPVRSFYVGSERYCRDYHTTVVLKDNVLSGSGTACRQANGDWKILSAALS